MKFKRFDNAVVTEESGRTIRAPVFIAADVAGVLRAADAWFEARHAECTRHKRGDKPDDDSAPCICGKNLRAANEATYALEDALRKAGA